MGEWAQWAFGTCGFYDKTIDLSQFTSHFKFPRPLLQACPLLDQYMQDLFESVHDSTVLSMLVHNVPMKNELIQELRNYLGHPSPRNWEESYWREPSVAKQLIFDQHSRCLIVSCHAELYEHQFQTGNYTRLYSDETRNLKAFDHLTTIQFPLCFMNSGPHDNFYETLDATFQDIRRIVQRDDIDLVCLACGFYGALLVHKVVSELGVSAAYFGSGLVEQFGINFFLKQREGSDENGRQTEFWIHECPSHLQYERADVIDIQRYFGRRDP